MDDRSAQWSPARKTRTRVDHVAFQIRRRMNAPSSTVAPPAKRSLFKKIVNNGEAAINRLREMAQREAEIARKYKSVLDACKAIEAEVATAQREFDANPTPAGVEKLI